MAESLRTTKVKKKKGKYKVAKDHSVGGFCCSLLRFEPEGISSRQTQNRSVLNFRVLKQQQWQKP